MTELSTLGAVIKTAYENEVNTNAFTDSDKAKLESTSQVAMSGSFSDLTNVPNFVELDPSGTIPMQYLNVSNLSFKGAWNATTNIPALVDGTGSVGDFYKVSVAGTHNFGNGDYLFSVGDWVMFAGGVWQRIGVHEAVSSVNNKTGAVVLTAVDVGAKPSAYVPTYTEITGKPDLPNLYVAKSSINSADGVAPLDANRKVPTTNLFLNVPGGYASLNSETKTPMAYLYTGVIGGIAPLNTELKLSSNWLYRNVANGIAGVGADNRVASVNLPTYLPQRARVWVDESANRERGTWYTNTSGNEMELFLSSNNANDGSYFNVQLRPNAAGTVMDFISNSTSNNTGFPSTRVFSNITVPVGWQYSVNTTNIATRTITKWYELR